MSIRHRPLLRLASAMLMLAVAGICTPALAADKAVKTDSTDSLARYKQERAVCISGQSKQDRATCLREASAALAQARQGDLNDGAAQYSGNARKRCESLPEEQRQACEARMQGQGSKSGSADTGGAYRELVTHETVAASDAALDKPVPQAPAK